MNKQSESGAGKLEKTPEKRLQAVQARVAQACQEAGRPAAAVTLLAISKTNPAEIIRPYLRAGQRHFGENRVQEAQQKWPDLKAEFPDCTLHLVGPLQSNKAAQAVALFDVIHTLDRPSLADALARLRDNGAELPKLLVQVNSGAEPQKSGVLPDDVPSFLDTCQADRGLAVAGLMCLPPVDAAPGPHFALLGKLAEAHNLPLLSMGMSGDFETAVQLGATHIRVGTDIFGPRG